MTLSWFALQQFLINEQQLVMSGRWCPVARQNIYPIYHPLLSRKHDIKNKQSMLFTFYASLVV